MKCVLCKWREVDSLNWNDTKIPKEKLVVCFSCRGKRKPGCIPHKQYCRYWLVFSEKWRRENKDVEEEDEEVTGRT